MARNEACASDSLRCDDTCTTYPPALSAEGADASRGTGGVTGRAGAATAAPSASCCGSSCSGPPRDPLVAGAVRAAVDEAPTGRVVASLPSERIVTVRIRLGSLGPAAALCAGAGGAASAASGGAAARVAMEAVLSGDAGVGATGTTAGGVGTLRTTGCSSRGTTRSAGAASPTRSWITLLDCGSVAGTILVGVLSATITGAAEGAELL